MRDPSCVVIESESGSNNGSNGDTNCVQSLDVFDTVVLVRLGWLAVVHFTDSLEAILLQVWPVGEVTDDPGERVAKVNAGSDC